MATFTGTSGNDTLTGTASPDTFILLQGGEDTASGLGGADVFSMGATLDSGDQLDGGAGFDQLWLRGNYSDGVVFGAATIQNIERIELGAGFNYNLTTNDANVAAGALLTVDASHLGADNTLTFDGSSEADGHFRLIGGAGNDVFTGGNGGDFFDLRAAGGTDTITGGSGDDIVLGGANFNANDAIDGGAGYNVLRLSGDYSSGLALGATALDNIDAIQVGAGHDYDITLDAAAVLPGQELIVSAKSLLAANSLTFDGSVGGGSELVMQGGGGNDNLTGGGAGDRFILSRGGNDTASGLGGNDVFDMSSTLNAADTLDGGAGSDAVLLAGHYGVTLGAATLTGIEALDLAAGFSYSITSNDGNVAAGDTLTVNGLALGAANNLVFDGSAETDGSFKLLGGAGNDTLTGGAGPDAIYGGLGQDLLTGGAGTDVFVYKSAAESNALTNIDRIVDFDADSDKIQLPFAVDHVDAISVAADTVSAAAASAGANLTAHGAVLVEVSTGILAGRAFLVVDANGDALYTPGTDYVINVSGIAHPGDFSTADFTTTA